MLYDLAVAYRIYPRVSKPTPVFAEDKLRLAGLCLASFRRALGPLRVKVHALLDGCPAEYEALFREHFAERDLQILPLTGIGNRPTFGRQIDVLLGQEDADLVYFAEDDYFYRPGAIAEMAAFLRGNADAHFITPYDHPDAYHLPLHPSRQEVRPFGFRHWSSTASTCLTFLTRREILRRTAPVFRTYQRTNLDVSLWMALTKQTALNPAAFVRCCLRRIQFGGYIAQAWRYSPFQLLFGPRYRLWKPLPSLATHMECSHLAPAVDWPAAFRNEGQVKTVDGPKG